MDNFKEININNNYVFLDDFQDMGEEETKHTDSYLLNFSGIHESSNLSNMSIIVSQIKSASDKNIFFKLLLSMAYCNPFVKFLVNILYKYFFNIQNDFHIEMILNKEEKKIVNMITIVFLVITNFILIFGSICDEYFLRIGLFLVNNSYLLYYVLGLYAENQFKINERKSSWNGLIDVLNKI